MDAAAQSLPLNQYNIPPGVTVDRVISKGEWVYNGPDGGYPQSATVIINRPLSASDVFLLTRTGSTSSNAELTSMSNMDPSVAAFNIHTKFISDWSLDQLLVAEISKRGGTERGVGIFTPYDQRMENFDINSTVFFPGNGSPYPMNFWTDVPNTFQRVRNVQWLNFTAVQLKGSNAPIEVQSLRAVDGQYKNSYGDIRGVFYSTSALLFNTTSGDINVTTGLDYTGLAETSQSTTSGNGGVSTNIVLSTPGQNRGGTFHVSNRTQNGGMSVDFPTAPVFSSLNLNVHNANGPVWVNLHPTFEGNFRQVAANAYLPGFQRQNVSDPTGQGRYRTISFTASPNPLAGVIYWGNDALIGNVNIDNNATNTLTV